MKMSMPTWLWGLVALVSMIIIGLLDFITGYDLSFMVFYFIPVSIAAWYISRRTAVVVSIFCTIVWFWVNVISEHVQLSYFYAAWNTVMRFLSFLAIGLALAKIRWLLDRQRQLVEGLRQSLSEVKVLEGFLPICSQCKKICAHDGRWQHLEKYISEHSNMQFAHSFCPECAKKFKKVV